MNNLKSAVIILIFGIFCLLSGCSRGRSPVEPGINTPDSPESIATAKSNRSVLAVFDAVIDPVAKTFTVTPSKDRLADYHFPLTQLYPNVLKITGYGWTPNFWADIKLTHPFPGSGIDAFDPRVIAILPARTGVEFYYPVFNAIGNHSVVLEPDGYTKLFDNLGGSIPGNTNPFKAYFKNQGHRVWSSTGTTSNTQRWNMNLSGFGGTMQFKLVVDVSTNYPNPPQPVIDNAPEPVKIDTVIYPGLTSAGGYAEIQVTFLDWQGAADIKCKVECPQLFNSAVQVFYESAGPNPNEYIFTGSIPNDLLAPEGNYKILVAAWDIPSDIHVFDEATASVAFEPVFNPVDVTTPWLDLDPYLSFFVDGNYMYVRDLQKGLCIFDISNLNSILPVGFLSVSSSHMDALAVSNGYAYGSDGYDDLLIMDVDPPETAHVVKTVDLSLTERNCRDIRISDGYAYFADSEQGLFIIDIDPPESASLVKQIACTAWDVEVSKGYAYVAGQDPGLQIIDIDPIESASIVKTVDAEGSVSGVSVSGDYAYVTDILNGLMIIDIATPEAAYLVNTIHLQQGAYEVVADNEYAYVLNSPFLQIVDINPPQTAHLINSIQTFDYPARLQICGGYAFIMTTNGLINIIDVKQPLSPQIVKIIPSVANNEEPVYAEGDYAYTVTRGNLHIIDIETPENAYVVNSVVQTWRESAKARGLSVKDGYAYFSYNGNPDADGFVIIDVDPPETAHEVIDINPITEVGGLFLSGEYLYLSCYSDGLKIFDVNPPEDTHLVGECDTPDKALDVFVEGEYAYIADKSSIQVVDISTPQSPSIVKSLDATPYRATTIFVSNGYAYTVDGYYHTLQIVDIEPLDSAYRVKVISEFINPHGLYVENGYAYVTDIFKGLCIVDVDPPESASIIKSIDPPEPYNVFVLNGYAYTVGKISIIKLW